ncbi:phage tail protein [Niveispirillum sp. SYP-B3756]|uniref:phage tail protein n=1 Tax=Niveispirillum sp. SYP-B3756 TaxID=2662178 RepID=UPI0012918D54|nr:tail fiber protein [Niveispirillum sp. SYP-B3756]MQP68262.1 phage tail protein [Niveispirillum sp. SYP-B3756]
MDPFLGEIRIFAGSYAPIDWSFCNGSTLAIKQYEALYALIGATYGGNAVTDFKIPDLRSRVPIHMGQGPGLTINHGLASIGGVETVTLTIAQVPAHTHAMNATTSQANSELPNNAQLATVDKGTQFITGNAPNLFSFPMSANMVSTTTGNQPHLNIMPTMGLNYIFCLTGIFPMHN